MTWQIMAGERQVSELWGLSGSGAVAMMYRYRRGKWESRTGFGEPWRRTTRPSPAGDLTERLMADLEGMA